MTNTDGEQLSNYLDSHGAPEEIAEHLTKTFQRIAIIRNMFVDEENRNQGMGTDLMNSAISDALSKGAQAILLISDEGESNEFDLTNWYRGFGFTQIGDAGGDPVMLFLR